MAVRAQCPRCKQALSVPNKLAGSYASCPRCQGRFWVSKDAPLDPSVSDSVGLPSLSTLTLTEAPAAMPPVASPPPPAPPVRPLPPLLGPASAGPAPLGIPASGTAFSQAPPRQYFPAATPHGSADGNPLPLPSVDGAPTVPPAAPPQARKVARLVSADTAQSSLKLAADGQLPHLQLQEDDKKDNSKGKSRSVSPLVLITAWVVSVTVTAAIMLDFGGSDSGATTLAKKEALTKIEEQYFGNPARGELLPYQRLLREARQARSRGDAKAEQQYYKQVLNLLHMETWGGAATAASRNRLEKGVTGSRDHDRELEHLILTVLGD